MKLWKSTVWTDGLDEFRKARFPLLSIGPEGVGKWDRLVRFAAQLGDPLSFPQPTIQDARYVALRHAQKPLERTGKVVTALNLSRATEAVQHALLKTLEDTSEWNVILLCSSTEPLRTVTSRCHVIRQGALRDIDVRRRLVEQGYSAVMVSTLADLCGGSPGRAEYLTRLWPRRSRVMSLIQALARRDRIALVDLSRTWDDDDWLATRRWCLEVISDWPQCFTEAELDMAAQLEREMVYEMVQASESMSMESMILRLWQK